MCESWKCWTFSFSFLQFSVSHLCQDGFRPRSPGKRLPASVPAFFTDNPRTWREHSLLRSDAQKQPPPPPILMLTRALEGRACSKPTEECQKGKVDKQWEVVARSTDAPLLPIVGWMGQSIDTLLSLLFILKNPHVLRSSIYPLKLSRGSGENVVSGLSTLKNPLPPRLCQRVVMDNKPLYYVSVPWREPRHTGHPHTSSAERSGNSIAALCSWVLFFFCYASWTPQNKE